MSQQIMIEFSSVRANFTAKGFTGSNFNLYKGSIQTRGVSRGNGAYGKR